MESLAPPEHRIGYALSQSLAHSLAQEHEAYGRRLRFRALGPDRFTYRAPPGCEVDMRCIYAELIINAAVLYSELLAHAAVGVASCEGWPVGMVPPQHDKPHLWKVLPPPELALPDID